MSTLAGKKILLGISGSIAAYKSAFLTRLLIRAGAEVQVLMTSAATDFISSLTLSTLSRRSVYSDVQGEEGWNNHVELGLWADAYVLAPVTANTLAKMAIGQSDNMLVAAYLSARCPVFVAPAMDLDMWKHPATRANVERLRSYGDRFFAVGHGELASGLVGEGRMAEPAEIVAGLEAFFALSDSPLTGKNVLITAGPTHEHLDPVRFLGNRSSGKMGIALAQEAARRGARVQLILGPTHLEVDGSGITVERVETARDMDAAARRHFPESQIAIFAAAVGDYRPATVADRKIKKKADSLELQLVRNPDIAAGLGADKQPGQILVGFALETDNELANARAKLQKKNLDMIVLNSLRDAGAGFQHDTNRVRILYRNDNNPQEFELKTKEAVARDILDGLCERFLA